MCDAAIVFILLKLHNWVN